jgi:MoCo/4Fe-4S cofactor protein with predicted Tat translocation signal
MNKRLEFANMQEAGRKTFWRSLEELSASHDFQNLVGGEFPSLSAARADEMDRRSFLMLMGASLALAGAAGCAVQPASPKTIVPRVRGAEGATPGEPAFYATAMTQGGCGVGLLVESHEGRPTKIEGNPQHPGSLGTTDLFHQASVLTLYDPDRSQGVTHRGQPATWDDAIAAIRESLETVRPRGGAGLHILSETVVSPTLNRQIDRLLRQFPEARWHQFEPLARDAAHRAARTGFGADVSTRFDLTKADVVLSLDSDFLNRAPGSLRYSHDFMSRRRMRTSAEQAAQARMNRLYVAETALTCTGSKADHRLALTGREIHAFAHAIAAELGVVDTWKQTGAPEKWVKAVAKDLARHRGRTVVIAGDRQPPSVHLLAQAINEQLGNVGSTVLHTRSIEARPVDQAESLQELLKECDAGRVEILLILGGNPVYTARSIAEPTTRAWSGE